MTIDSLENRYNSWEADSGTCSALLASELRRTLRWRVFQIERHVQLIELNIVPVTTFHRFRNQSFFPISLENALHVP